jgi:glutamine synthetase
MDNLISMNPNPLVQYLKKLPSEFTKSDLIKYIEDNKIEMINFRYTGGDGRLKTLNFVITNKEHLDGILSSGERVDGSSLFKNINIQTSDLYVVPRYKTAFVNPFSEIPAIDILCAYYDKDGAPLSSSPDYILTKAHNVLKKETGYSFEVMGEMEYYIISPKNNSFQATDQRGYHESEPFCKWGEFRKDAMKAIAKCGGNIKYGHSEVGSFSDENFTFEQHEIEFNPTNLEDAADQLQIAKWILRTLANKHGITLTFAPKITTGKAGSGFHIHTRLLKNGKNIMIENGKLSDIAKKSIAGFLYLAPSLTAFGNTNPTSYFRLVPHQEAPTYVCWGDMNRLGLVRVPLGWSGAVNMIHDVNHKEKSIPKDFSEKQTVEFRCPDGSANIYLLLAGLTVAARHGLQMKDALEFAEKTYVKVNIFEEKHKDILANLFSLPSSCMESADWLEKQADIYLQHDVFSRNIINGVVNELKKYNDKNLMSELGNDNEKIMSLVSKYIHCG